MGRDPPPLDPPSALAISSMLSPTPWAGPLELGLAGLAAEAELARLPWLGGRPGMRPGPGSMLLLFRAWVEGGGMCCACGCVWLRVRVRRGEGGS